MIQSTSCNGTQDGLHLAIIMDGNGRWAAARGLPRLAGHRRGADAVRRVVEAAPGLGIATLTLYAFSADNWARPSQEVHGLMDLFRHYLDSEVEALVRDGVRLTVIGRRDRLALDVLGAVIGFEAPTADPHRLLGAGRDPPRGPGPRGRRHARGLRPAAGRGVRRAARSARRRPPHPHRRRAAALGLPALGMRLRGALLQRAHVAGVQRLGPGGRGPGILRSRAPVRRGVGGAASAKGGAAMSARPAADEPFRAHARRPWLPPDMTTPPPLDPAAPGGPIERRFALLINPFYPKDPHASFGKHVLTPTLALTSVAGATPPGWRVRYWDENLLQGPPPVDPVPEVVGISVHLTFASRAYDLARWYRARGARVVLGGLHVLSCPEEAAPHADALAIGDGVQLWPVILDDVENDRLEPVYRAMYDNAHRDPPPKRDLLP